MSDVEGWTGVKPSRQRYSNRCDAGPKCTFAHGKHELTPYIQKTRKTIPCERYSSPEGCKYDKLVCNFAHGNEDVRKNDESSGSQQAGQTTPCEVFYKNKNELVSSGSAASTHSANCLGVQAAARKAAATSTSPTVGHTDAQTQTEPHTDSVPVLVRAPVPAPAPGPKCILCNDSPRETTLAPCGHKVCCRKCTEMRLLEESDEYPWCAKCPWCEIKVDSFILKTICPA